MPEAYQIARGSYRKTVQNLSLAFIFNGIGAPLAVTGLLHPVWAMLAMVASVSTVLLNSFSGLRRVALAREVAVTLLVAVLMALFVAAYLALTGGMR